MVFVVRRWIQCSAVGVLGGVDFLHRFRLLRSSFSAVLAGCAKALER
jgi:hypothetical protein